MKVPGGKCLQWLDISELKIPKLIDLCGFLLEMVFIVCGRLRDIHHSATYVLH